MITQKDKKRVAFTFGPADLHYVLRAAKGEWFALGNSVPFKVTLLFEGTETARGWIGAMREGDK